MLTITMVEMTFELYLHGVIRVFEREYYTYNYFKCIVSNLTDPCMLLFWILL